MSHLSARFAGSLIVASLLGLGSSAEAGGQRGPQEFSHVQLGVQPVGVQVDDDRAVFYKTAFDFSGLLTHANRIGIWLGGGLNYAVHDGPFHDVQPWMFVLLTFERFIPFPLVPMVQAGLGTDLFIDRNGDLIVGTLAFRVGAGAHYWVTRNIGLGLETHITWGPTFSNTNPVQVHGYGTWDHVFGARFAF